jgi:hypothetical protein
MRESRLCWKDTHESTYLPEDEIKLPEWWMPGVPAYMGYDGRMEPDLRKHLIRLLGIATEYQKNLFLPRLDNAKPESAFSNVIVYMLGTYSWRDGVAFLSHEIDYFWEQAIIKPSVEDFAYLQRSRKYAENLYRDLKAWIAEVEPLLEPNSYCNETLLVNELTDLLDQSSNFRRQTTDTFQLLIGAIAIRDSEIQKQLARESRIQARRSTALTALAAIYLPLSLTTGVFGMNISEIGQGVPKYWAVLALGLGLLVVTLPFLLWIFIDNDDKDEAREKLPVSTQHRDGHGSGHLVAQVGDTRKHEDLRTKMRDAGAIRRRTTMSSRMGRVATDELRLNTHGRSGDIV